jgi:hypothetical protein
MQHVRFGPDVSVGMGDARYEGVRPRGILKGVAGGDYRADPGWGEPAGGEYHRDGGARRADGGRREGEGGAEGADAEEAARDADNAAHGVAGTAPVPGPVVDGTLVLTVRGPARLRTTRAALRMALGGELAVVESRDRVLPLELQVAASANPAAPTPQLTPAQMQQQQPGRQGGCTVTLAAPSAAVTDILPVTVAPPQVLYVDSASLLVSTPNLRLTLERGRLEGMGVVRAVKLGGLEAQLFLASRGTPVYLPILGSQALLDPGVFLACVAEAPGDAALTREVGKLKVTGTCTVWVQKHEVPAPEQQPPPHQPPHQPPRQPPRQPPQRPYGTAPQPRQGPRQGPQQGPQQPGQGPRQGP